MSGRQRGARENKGEVDGLLGPLTREALAAYQADQGLTTTAAIDEPTLDSLEMS
jgi:peptidoglycan hydrolase-like protein with peptidoglycan-binding domain